MHFPESLPLLLIFLLFLPLLHTLFICPLCLRLSRQSLYLLRCQLRLKLILGQLVLPYAQHLLPYVKRKMKPLNLLAVLVLVVALQILQQDVLFAILISLYFKGIS
jgi:hypothetical protein